jgi:hypothetical protein
MNVIFVNNKQVMFIDSLMIFPPFQSVHVSHYDHVDIISCSLDTCIVLLFVYIVAPEQVKMVARGVDMPKKVREAVS